MRMKNWCLLSMLALALFLPRPALSQGAEGRTRIGISVLLDGSAKWVISEEMDLPTPEDRDAFVNYSDMIESNKALFLSDISDIFQNLVSSASNVTGREMAARDFDVITKIVGINKEIGVIEYSFTWTNFAEIDGSVMTISDVFEGGFYLYENDTLILEYPPELHLKVTLPPADSISTNEVVWYGRRDFGWGEPKVVLEDRRTSLTIFISKAEPIIGDELIISGQISPTLGGEPITLTVTSPNGPQIISLTTSQDGTYLVSIVPDEPGQWSISVSYPGRGVYLGSKVESTFTVKQDLLRYLQRSPYLPSITILAIFTSSFLVFWAVMRRGKRMDYQEPLTKTDYDLIISMLRNAGGAMLQSKMRLDTGFSGAKLSRILKELEQRGEIRKEKRGREQAVFLVERR